MKAKGEGWDKGRDGNEGEGKKKRSSPIFLIIYDH